VIVCGVDEAGRGPLAGPVYAAAVVLPQPCGIEGLRDSKALTERQRERLFGQITRLALSYAVASASEEEIERVNILQASLLAMRRAVASLAVTPDLLLVDGSQAGGFPLPARAVVKGDRLHPCISAASVLAKVTRDAHMREAARLYPGYGFERHKGYGTKAHYAALAALGPCPIHRRSFL
jgi:ribonuclease HII